MTFNWRPSRFHQSTLPTPLVSRWGYEIACKISEPYCSFVEIWRNQTTMTTFHSFRHWVVVTFFARPPNLLISTKVVKSVLYHYNTFSVYVPKLAWKAHKKYGFNWPQLNGLVICTQSRVCKHISWALFCLDNNNNKKTTTTTFYYSFCYYLLSNCTSQSTNNAKTSRNITRYLYSRGPVRQVSCHWPIS